MDQTYMKKQNILKLLLTMALPMVISMLVNSLYNIVDSFFVAKISENAMTAISLVFPMQNFINSVMIGFGIGINAVIAFYMGASDKETADKAASQGLFLSTVHGIVLMSGCIILIRLQYGAVNASAMDGGTSTQMYYDGEVINKPYSPTGPRTLPTAFLIK